MDKYVKMADVLETLKKANIGGYITDRLMEIPATDVQPINQWISCKDEMPEDGISVLICSYRGTVSKATYDSDMGYFYIADSELHYNELDITHWQPLPKAPVNE